MDADVDPHVGPVEVDGRPPPVSVPYPIDDGVLDPASGESGVGQALAGPDRVHRERAVDRHVLLPGDGGQPLVQRVGVLRVSLPEPQQHAAGHPRPQARAQTHLEAPGEGHRGDGRAQVRGAERDQLVGEQVLDVLGTCGRVAEGVFHRASVAHSPRTPWKVSAPSSNTMSPRTSASSLRRPRTSTSCGVMVPSSDAPVV
jgi:hypothetical protein